MDVAIVSASWRGCNNRVGLPACAIDARVSRLGRQTRELGQWTGTAPPDWGWNGARGRRTGRWDLSMLSARIHGCTNKAFLPLWWHGARRTSTPVRHSRPAQDARVQMRARLGVWYAGGREGGGAMVGDGLLRANWAFLPVAAYASMPDASMIFLDLVKTLLHAHCFEDALIS